jgi:hypothetical protein
MITQETNTIRIWHLLFVAWAAISLLLSLLSYSFSWITWGGETFYFLSADSLVSSGTFQFSGEFNESTPILYPLAIAPALLFKDVFVASEVARLLNSLYFSSVIFPVFQISRGLMPVRRAVVVSILSPLVGMVYYSGFFIAENLYYPLFYWTLFVVSRLLSAGGWGYGILAAIALVSAYLTKASASALIVSSVLTLITFALAIRRQRGQNFQVKGIFVLILIIAGAFMAMASLRTAANLTPLPYWGVFVDFLTTLKSLRLGDLLFWMARFIGQVGVLAGGGMLVLAIPSIASALRDKSPKHQYAFAMLSVWVLTCVIAQAAWFNGYLYGWLVERHVFALLPMLLIWAAVNTGFQKYRLLAVIVLLMMATVFFVPEYEYFSHGTDISGVDEVWVRVGMAALALGVAVISLSSAWRDRPNAAFLIACAGWLAFNVALIVPMQYAFYKSETARERERDLPVAKAMCDLFDRPANIVFLPTIGSVMKDQVIKDYIYYCRDYVSRVNPAVPFTGRPFYAVVEPGALPLPDNAPSSWVKIQSMNGIAIYKR